MPSPVTSHVQRFGFSWHMAPFWGCMQVEKPCLPMLLMDWHLNALNLRSASHLLHILLLTFSAGQCQSPWSANKCNLCPHFMVFFTEWGYKRMNCRNSIGKSNRFSLVWLCLQEQSQREHEREEKTIPSTETKQSSTSPFLCCCMNHKMLSVMANFSASILIIKPIFFSVRSSKQ